MIAPNTQPNTRSFREMFVVLSFFWSVMGPLRSMQGVMASQGWFDGRATYGLK